MTFEGIFQKAIKLFSAGPVAGGLEVGDSVLRFVASDPANPLAVAVRLPPDVFVAGRIKDEAAFRNGLRDLRTRVLGKKASSSAPINVVVSLSSINIYSQVFALPLLEGENLERAVDLNIKMALPSGTAETYSGWQTLSASADSRIEILSAFFDKNLADDLSDVLREEKFAPVAIEPRSLALARLFKDTGGGGFDTRSSLILVSADTSGLDVSIIRGGNLHFDYFHSWHDLQGEERQMTLEEFQNAVTRSVSQILNFYNSHWKEPLSGILVATTGMEAEITAAVSKNFQLTVRPFVPRVGGLGAEWFVAWGSALRGRVPRRDDKELSLLGIKAQDLFHREQVEHFLRFWRLLVPLSLLVLVAVFLGSRAFVGNLLKELESRPLFTLSTESSREAAALKAEASEFNASVAYLSAVERLSSPKSPALVQALDIASRRDIAVYRLSLGGPTTPIAFSGSAESEEAIREFRTELSLTPGIREVNLPLTEIRKDGDRYVFSVSFISS